jgi:hypothetical protein
MRRIVLAQMEGSGRGSLGSYNAHGYDTLSSFLAEQPMRDGDAWLELLLKKDEMLGALLSALHRFDCALRRFFEWLHA